MQTVLDQSSIDALFAAQAPPPLPAIAAETAADLARFNFGGAGQISSEQMRAISVVNDHFARNLMHTLGAWLRAQTDVMLVAGEQMPYGEFLARIPEPAYVGLLRLEPLGAVGLLQIDLNIAMTAVELLLGGGASTGEPRAITDIEDAILVSVVDVIVRELNAAWAAVGLAFAFDCRDAEGKVPRLMSSGERMLCVGFEVHLLGMQGLINFCLPAVVINTVHRRLVAVRETPRPRFAASATHVAASMGTATFALSLRLPPVRLASHVVLGLQVGAVLELPLPQHTSAELRTAGVWVSAASPVHRDGHKAAKLLTAPRGLLTAGATPMAASGESA